MSDSFARARAAALVACAGLLAACGAARVRSEAGPAAMLARAQRDLDDGRARDAQRGFEEALEQDPKLYPAIRGRIEAARARSAAALQKVADEALARTQARGGDAEGLAWHALGLCRFAAADRARARAALTRAAQLLREEADPQFRLGAALFDGKQFAEARVPLARAAERAPEGPPPHIYLGGLSAAKDRPEEAAGEYAAALERDLLDVVTLRKLGELRLSRLARPREAIEPLSRAAALVPSGDGVQLLLAAAELAGGKAQEGRARLQRLADERPADTEVLLRLALVLYDEPAQAPPEP